MRTLAPGKPTHHRTAEIIDFPSGTRKKDSPRAVACREVINVLTDLIGDPWSDQICGAVVVTISTDGAFNYRVAGSLRADPARAVIGLQRLANDLLWDEGDGVDSRK